MGGRKEQSHILRTMKALPVAERFHTWQGEGVFLGLPAFFIRLYGCPVHCPWCDSAGTWHPDYKPSANKLERLEPDVLANEAVAAGTPRVVITGGEPAIHDLKDLVWHIQFRDMVTHLETSGGFPVDAAFDWITLSPKKWKPPIEEMVRKANEFKFIIETPDDISLYYEMICSKGYRCAELDCLPTPPIWLHPEWSKRNDPVVLKAISAAVKSGRDVFRAGYQLHRVYQVDALDPRSKPQVPLGGDPARGY